MKTIGFASMLVLIVGTVYSQTQFEKAMSDGLDSMKTMHTAEDCQRMANYFERIANAESGQWLPEYYSAYCNLVLFFRQQAPEKGEMILINAENQINRIMKMDAEESEIYALQGMLYQGYILLDPQTNGPTYSSMANAAFDKSTSLDPSNPRAYYLKGLNVLYTPEAYGGGMKRACPLFHKAQELYEKFEKKNSLMPVWGKESNDKQLNSCISAEQENREKGKN